MPYDPSQNHHYATQHSHNQHHSQRLQPSFRPSSHQQQQQQQTQHHQSQWHHRPNLRRQPENTRTRGHRRLPPPSAHYNTNNHYQHQGTHEQWYHSWTFCMKIAQVGNTEWQCHNKFLYLEMHHIGTLLSNSIFSIAPSSSDHSQTCRDHDDLIWI